MRLFHAVVLLLAAPFLWAQEAGDFDYYLLALSWSPSWCETTGDEREAPECRPGSNLGFVLHGLWPQYEAGWPEWCDTAKRDPSRRETAAMADLMGSGGLAWHQWQKHGRCTGLDPEDYFALSRQAFGTVILPELEPGRLTAEELEEAILALNPDLGPDGLIVTCHEGLVQEVRICLDRDLEPRDCGVDVLERACPVYRELALPPPR